jgi:hypothetical protein
MNKLINLNWKLTTTITVLLFGSLMSTDILAKRLYKSVDADGKITYSNFAPSGSATSKNVSLLKDTPKFSVSNKSYNQGARKS